MTGFSDHSILHYVVTVACGLHVWYIIKVHLPNCACWDLMFLPTGTASALCGFTMPFVKSPVSLVATGHEAAGSPKLGSQCPRQGGPGIAWC